MIVERLAPVTSARLTILSEDVSVRAAADSFSDIQLGLIVVCGEGGQATGVVSKSDLVRHLARSGAAGTPIREVMTRSIVYCLPGQDLNDAWQSMRLRRLQNMPVLENGRRPVGVLDVRDALQAILREEQDQERLLVNYIAGVEYR